jgi:hypothetical protein
MSIFDTTSTCAAPGLLGSDSNRSEEASRSKSLPDLEEDLDRLFKIQDKRATARRGLPVLNYDSDSNEEYPSTTSPGRGGLEDRGATACREAPVLIIHSQPDDYSKSFLGNHPSLTITSMPQDRFVYWKGLEPSELLEFDSRLVAQSTLRRIDPREPEDFDYSVQLHLTSQHRHGAATTSTTRLAPQSQLLRQINSANDNFNNSSRLETSRKQSTNYSATSSARSKTSRNQLRLVGSNDKLHMDQIRFKVVQPRTLSALEEDLDHPPPLEEGEATVRWGVIVFDNYSDAAAHVTRGLVRGSDWSGRFGYRKGTKPSRSL